MSELIPQQSSVIEGLTAAEMAIAERVSNTSITSLEDPHLPKVELLAALGWVYAKRSDSSMTFKEYKESRTLTQITGELGLGGDDESAGDGEPDAEGNDDDPTPPKTSSSTRKRSGSQRSS